MHVEAATRIESILHDGIGGGSFLGAQAFATAGGDVVADVAVGEARIGTPMTNDTIVSWQCNAKPATAVAVCRLWERGVLDLDAPVAEYVPEFARNGKDAVTVRHLLTHTAGFANDPPIASAAPLAADRVEAMTAGAMLLPDWVPGSQFRYSAWLGYSTLGVVISRIDGRPFSQFVREEVFKPLGMDDCWIGADLNVAERVAERMSLLYNTSGPEPVARPDGGPGLARSMATGSPASGAVGPTRQLGRLWQDLLDTFSGGRHGLLRRETVQAMVRNEGSHYGLGVMVVPGYFGDWCPNAFGHDGMRSTLAFADPEHKVVVAVVLNGFGGGASHLGLIRDVGRAVYESL